MFSRRTPRVWASSFGVAVRCSSTPMMRILRGWDSARTSRGSSTSEIGFKRVTSFLVRRGTDLTVRFMGLAGVPGANPLLKPDPALPLPIGGLASVPRIPLGGRDDRHPYGDRPGRAAHRAPPRGDRGAAPALRGARG